MGGGHELTTGRAALEFNSRRSYIGNAAEYAVYALKSGKVQQFVQGPEMAKLFGEAFKPRAPRISVGARQGIGTFGTQAGEIYTGYTEL